MPGLYDIVIWIGTVVISISLIMAYSINKKQYIPPYLKRFYWYPLLALAISTNTIASQHFRLHPSSIYYSIQNIFELIDITFWGLFFLRLLKGTKSYKHTKNIFLLFLFTGTLFMFITNISKVNFQAYAICNLGKCLFCILYFNNLFKDNPKLNLKSEPSFWIVTGLFFYSAITLPEYAIYDYLRKNLDRLILNNIFAASNMAIIIMHILFINAYLCSIRQKGIS